jgi:hypothetical protein
MGDISYQAKDILFKTISEMYKDKTLDFLGLNLPKIKEMLPNSFPAVKTDERRADNIFKLEDDSILLLEYESNSRITENMLKYLDYTNRILSRYYTEDKKLVKVRLVVVYCSDIENAETEINAGSISLKTEAVFMKNYDGIKIYNKLKTKIKQGEELNDLDLINCILLPLMKHNKQRQEIIKESIELAKDIKDEKKQYFAIGGLLTATNNFIDEKYAEEVRRWLKMTMVEKVYEKEKIDAVNQAKKETKKETEKSRSINIAKKMLENGEDIIKIMEYTELSASEIESLK